MLIEETIKCSKTLNFFLKVQELKNQGKDIISLGLGEPDFDTPEHIKEAAIEALRAGMTRYSTAPGIEELRELIALKLMRDNNIDTKPDEIIITPGAKNALFIACAALLRPGDEVINFTPCYVSNIPILNLAEPQVIVHNIPLNEELLSVDQEKVLSLVNERTRLIFINYPNNPTGKMIDKEDAYFLKDLLRKRKNIYLLTDEIYERLVLSEKSHISMASFSDISERVITVNGFSKAYAMTGWRIGYVHANKELIRLMVKIHQHINTNTAVFIQRAAIAALKGPNHHLDEFIKRLRKNAAIFRSFYESNPYIKTYPIEGGFFGFLNIESTRLNSDSFCTQLLEKTGVAILPGILFGNMYDQFVRVSIVTSNETLIEGFNRISDFLRSIRKRQ